MKKEITVDEAISRGIWLIKIPAYLIFTLFLCIGIYFSLKYNYSKYYIVIFSILAFFPLFLFSILAVPKWKVWAFGNVRNVHELRRKALSKNIIVTENIWTTKAEIFIGADKQKWQEIQKKFLIPDEVSFNKNLPDSIEIMNSTFKLLLPIIAYSFFIFVIAIMMMIDRNFLGMGFFFLIILGLFLYFDIMNFNKRKNAILRLNLDGIKTEDHFYYWKDIKDERLFTSYGYRRLPYHYLKFNSIKNNDEFSVSINNINIKRSQLLDLIIEFRNRFDTNNIS